MKMSRRDRGLWSALVLLGAVLVLFEHTGLDLALQDRFYDFGAGRWLVDGQEPVGRWFFYHGPKTAVWLIGLTLLGLLAGPEAWRRRLGFAQRDLAVAVLTLATLPALAGIGKNLTNVHCPSEVRRYGGDTAYAKLCEPYPADDPPAERGHCFPAGHASGGFALMGLAWLRPTRRWRLGGLALGLGLGWWMGIYQMLKGAHYLSHTLVTMCVAVIVMLAWRRWLGPEQERV
jgi:membrane-associated PAP2 superfamily phosphatase